MRPGTCSHLSIRRGSALLIGVMLLVTAQARSKPRVSLVVAIDSVSFTTVSAAEAFGQYLQSK